MEYRPEAYTEEQHRALDKLLNELNTPDKIYSWRQDPKRFQYDYIWFGHVMSTKHRDVDWRLDLVRRDMRPPVVLFATGKAVCYELGNFAANALMRAGYQVANVMAMRYDKFEGKERGHMVCAYKDKEDGMWYTIGDTRNFRNGPYRSLSQLAHKGINAAKTTRWYTLPIVPAKSFDS